MPPKHSPLPNRSASSAAPCLAAFPGRLYGRAFSCARCWGYDAGLSRGRLPFDERQGPLLPIEMRPKTEQRVRCEIGLLIIDETPESRRINSAFLGKTADRYASISQICADVVSQCVIIHGTNLSNDNIKVKTNIVVQLLPFDTIWLQKGHEYGKNFQESPAKSS